MYVQNPYNQEFLKHFEKGIKAKITMTVVIIDHPALRAVWLSPVFCIPNSRSSEVHRCSTSRKLALYLSYHTRQIIKDMLVFEPEHGIALIFQPCIAFLVE